MDIDERRLVIDENLIGGKAGRLNGLPLIKSERTEMLSEVVATRHMCWINGPSRGGGRCTFPNIRVEVKVILNKNVAGVRLLIVWLFADLNLGLSIETADTAHPIGGRHRDRLIAVVPTIDLQVIHGGGLLELDGGRVHRNLIGCIRLELNEGGTGTVFLSNLFRLSALVVQHH